MNVDARQQTINVMLQEVVNILHAQHVPVNRETVSNVLEQMTGSNLEALGDPPLPPPQEAPDSLPIDPLDPFRAQSFTVVPNIENMPIIPSIPPPPSPTTLAGASENEMTDQEVQNAPPRSPAPTINLASPTTPNFSPTSLAATEAGYSDDGGTLTLTHVPPEAQLPPGGLPLIMRPAGPPKTGAMLPPGRVPIKQGKAAPTGALATQAVAAQAVARAGTLAKHRQGAAPWGRNFGEPVVFNDFDFDTPATGSSSSTADKGKGKGTDRPNPY